MQPRDTAGGPAVRPSLPGPTAALRVCLPFKVPQARRGRQHETDHLYPGQ